jgi:hypothetical protein
VPPAAATPRIRLAVDTMPSLAPMTEARSHPIRSERWRSSCRMGIFHLFIFQFILANIHSAAKTLIDFFNGKQYYIP